MSWMNPDLRLIGIILSKNVKQILRNPAIKSLLIWGHILTFGMLYLIWLSSNGRMMRFQSSSAFTPMSFDLSCAPQYSADSQLKLDCNPKRTQENLFVDGLSPADILLNLLTSGDMLKDKSASSDVTSLVSSMMMNGVPLLGFQDFILLSDFFNQHISKAEQERAMRYAVYREKFSNLLEIRSRELRFASNNTLTSKFLDYLKSTTPAFKDLKIQVFDNMESALDSCCDSIFAIIEIVEKPSLLPNTSFSSFFEKNFFDENIDDEAPRFTIRMHPSSIPDTRNFMWSQRKGSLPKYSSGELSYFLSGFLSLQFEIQNFLSIENFGGNAIDSRVFQSPNSFPNPVDMLRDIASTLLTTHQNFSSMNSSWIHHSKKRQTFPVSLYHRSFPNHAYQEDAFWHGFGSIITICLVVFCSIPAAISGGHFQSEYINGHLDLLDTCRGPPEDSRGRWVAPLGPVHSAAAWCVTCCIWSSFTAFVSWIYFLLVLNHSLSWIPAMGLMLFGCCLGPISLTVGVLITRADTLVLFTPTLAFILMLPGMLYFDIAFDIQRSLFVEVIYCFLPSSAVSMLLRHIFSFEALNIEVNLTFPAIVSKTPTFIYLLMLLLDFLVYLLICLITIDLCYRKRTHIYSNNEGTTENITPSKFVNTIDKLGRIIKRFVSYALPSKYQYTEIVDNSLTEVEMGQQSNNVSDLQFKEKMVIRNVSKWYSTFRKKKIQVLDNINTEIEIGKVYTLLGSNGAGKTTFMRILSGLDSNFQGSVSVRRRKQDLIQRHDGNDSPTRYRVVGWCPQIDPLFPYLTVREHLELIYQLLLAVNVSADIQTQAANFASEQMNLSFYGKELKFHHKQSNHLLKSQELLMSAEIDQLLVDLDLQLHANKLSSCLSGGMKRRLSLAMSLLGRPSFIILDEPSSGCDSYTREFLRRVVLDQRQAGVIVSTHHVDDIEIISDNVMFINDKQLVYNGCIDEMFKRYHESNSPSSPRTSRKRNDTLDSQSSRTYRSPNSDANKDDSLYQSLSDICIRPNLDVNIFLEFLTSDPKVLNQLNEWNLNTDAGLRSRVIGHDSFSPTEQGKVAFTIPENQIPQFSQFLEELERLGLCNWILRHENIYDVIKVMYPDTNVIEEIENEIPQGKSMTTNEVPTTKEDSSVQPNSSKFWCFGINFGINTAILYLRWREFLTSFSEFSLSQMLFPFAITLLICLSCKDISYPKIEITSESIGGIGEVLLSYGKHVRSNSTVPGSKFNISDTRSYILKNDKKLDVLLSYFGSTLTFEGESNSNQLWSTLFNEYYEHEDNRWSSFVVDDKIEKWIESSVTFNQVDFQAKNISLDKIYQNIVDSYNSICENNEEENLDNFVQGYDLVDKSDSVLGYDDVIDKTPDENEKSLPKIAENVGQFSEDIMLNSKSSYRQLLSKSKIGELIPNNKIETVDSGDNFVKRSVHVCDKHPYFTISLLKTYSFPNATRHESRIQRENHWGDESSDDAVEAETFFIISAFESLHSNLTMLFNISSDHSLPVFYKEIAPIIYNVYNGVGKFNIGNNQTDKYYGIAGNAQSSTSLQNYQSNYRLYSYPLPEINYNNRIYSQRGYIGSIMILLYILISTAKAVTVFTEIHESKMKNLFYLSGINFVEYFITNIFFDIILLLFGFFSVYFGILVGGSPVDKYFLSFYDSTFGFIFIVLNILFACSIVISSYFYTLNSLSVISNQLFLLLTSIFCGIFMKLYFDKHSELSTLATIVRVFCPSYNYSLAIFELFKWNTVNLMIIGEVHILGKEMQLIFKNIMDSMMIMGAQCVYYMILIIIFEKYQLKIKQNTQYVKRIVYITIYSLWKLLPDFNEVFHISYFDKYSSKKNFVASGSRKPISNSGLVFDMLKQNRTEIGMLPLLSLRRANTHEHSPKLNRSYSSFDSPSNSSSNSAVQSHGHVAEDHIVLSHEMEKVKTKDDENTKSTGKSPFAGFTMNRKVRSNSFDSNVSQISFGSSMQWIVDEDNEEDSFLENDKNFLWDEECAHKNERESENLYSRHSINKGFRLKNMYVEYSNNNHKLSLRKLNINIRPNDRIALMGINGSGKSTLFKTLTFIENVPIFGDITFDGRSVIDSYYDMCESNFVSFVPQEMKYLNYLTVYDVFYIFHKLKFRSESRIRFSADLANFTRSSRSLLSDRYTHYPISLLSGGNKKRLFLGVAALVDPRLLLLDECTSGVDPIAAENIISFLSRFYASENNSTIEKGDNVDRSLLFASHRIDECINICKQVVILNAGQVVFDGSIDSFFHISNAFYQIDITLHEELTAPSRSPNNAVSPTLSTMSDIHDSNIEFEDIFTQNKKHFDIILRIKHEDTDPSTNIQRTHLDFMQENYQGQMFVGNGVERYIVYSPLLLRITCNKVKLPLSKVLMLLQIMKTDGDIASFAIREMNMEEVLSNIIDTINE